MHYLGDGYVQPSSIIQIRNNIKLLLGEGELTFAMGETPNLQTLLLVVECRIVSPEAIHTKIYTGKTYVCIYT